MLSNSCNDQYGDVLPKCVSHLMIIGFLLSLLWRVDVVCTSFQFCCQVGSCVPRVALVTAAGGTRITCSSFLSMSMLCNLFPSASANDNRDSFQHGMAICAPSACPSLYCYIRDPILHRVQRRAPSRL